MQQTDNRPGILVADDEHGVRVMVQLTLERSGYLVWTACNGQEALRLYQAYRTLIDLVLLDVRMPILDGPSTLDALRALNPDVIACFMSGETGEYSTQDLLQRGAASVLVKPFRLDDLTSALTSLVPRLPASAICGPAPA